MDFRKEGPLHIVANEQVMWSTKLFPLVQDTVIGSEQYLNECLCIQNALRTTKE